MATIPPEPEELVEPDFELENGHEFTAAFGAGINYNFAKNLLIDVSYTRYLGKNNDTGEEVAEENFKDTIEDINLISIGITLHFE